MKRLCHRAWIKVALLMTMALAMYEIYSVMMMAQCSDEDLQQSLKSLCRLFHDGQIAGDLCPALCDTKEIIYRSCLNYRHGKRVVTVSYGGTEMVLKSKHSYLHEFPDLTYTYENKTYFPEVMDFNRMLIDTLAVNFDVEIPERRDMLTRLWTLPFHELKTEADRKAAMRSIWSLVQQDEYLIYRYYDNVDSFPDIKGSCGFYYAVENAPPGPVLGAKPLTMNGDSPWDERRDIALKLLEAVVNLESTMQGRFHLCDVKAENFGLNVNNEVKVIDVDMAFSSKRLFEQFDMETCRSDKDCLVLDCYGKCDMTRNICMKMRKNSNLQAVCNKIFSHKLATGYRGLLRYPPSLLKDPLDVILHDCSSISFGAPDFNGNDQETIYWKLKNLLKKSLAVQIADYVGLR